MSAQRRSASKRNATALPPRRAANGRGTSERGAVAATAEPVAAARSAPAPRPPKPAERAKGAAPERGGVNRRFDGLRRSYADTVAEMKKINWPDRETTKNLTIVVIGISVVLGILLGGVDFLLQAVFEAVP